MIFHVPTANRYRKTRVDEVPTTAEIEESNDVGGVGPQSGSIDGLARELLGRLSDLPFVPTVPQLVQPLPPVPGLTTLPPLSDLTRLRATLIPNENPLETPDEDQPSARNPWRLEDSIFALKVKAGRNLPTS